MASLALAETSTAVGDLNVSAYTIPTDAPEADGTMAWDSTTMIVVQVHCDGEVGTGWTYGSPVCAEARATATARSVDGSVSRIPPTVDR